MTPGDVCLSSVSCLCALCFLLPLFKASISFCISYEQPPGTDTLTADAQFCLPAFKLNCAEECPSLAFTGVDGTSLLACELNDDDERPSLARAFSGAEELPLLPASARNPI